MNEIWQRNSPSSARQIVDAETAKQFVKRTQEQPSKLPPGFPDRWNKPAKPGTHSQKQRVPGRSTWHYRYPVNKTYALRHYNTDILTWKPGGIVVVNNGGFATRSTLRRINARLPHGWEIYALGSRWYWFNLGYPPELLTHPKRHNPEFVRPIRSWLTKLPFRSGDQIDRMGNLNCVVGTINTAGEVINHGSSAIVIEPLAQEALLLANKLLEGNYHRNLDRQRRIEAKYKKIKQIDKLKRDLTKIDEPDKRKKRLNLH